MTQVCGRWVKMTQVVGSVTFCNSSLKCWPGLFVLHGAYYNRERLIDTLRVLAAFLLYMTRRMGEGMSASARVGRGGGGHGKNVACT